MFNYYDINTDQLLSEAELIDIEHRDHLEKLSQNCHLVDLLTFDDSDRDLRISMEEFYHALRKWFDILVWFGLIHYSAFSAAKAM